MAIDSIEVCHRPNVWPLYRVTEGNLRELAAMVGGEVRRAPGGRWVVRFRDYFNEIDYAYVGGFITKTNNAGYSSVDAKYAKTYFLQITERENHVPTFTSVDPWIDRDCVLGSDGADASAQRCDWAG
jgi:hypothetical protein